MKIAVCGKMASVTSFVARFVLSLAPFFPLLLPSSFGKSLSVTMIFVIPFLDIFLD